MLVCKKKNMLYHNMIGSCFNVDAYQDRREEESFSFKVKEYAKA